MSVTGKARKLQSLSPRDGRHSIITTYQLPLYETNIVACSLFLMGLVLQISSRWRCFGVHGALSQLLALCSAANL